MIILMTQHKVKIIPDNIEMLVEDNTPLKELFTEKGINFEFPCGGLGVCKRCKVKVVKGDSHEEVLACQLKVNRDLTIEIPSREEQHNILVKGLERQVALEPLVKKLPLELPKPTLADNVDDWTRLAGENGVAPKLRVLQQLPDKLREKDFKIVIVIANDEIVAIEGQDSKDTLYGIAFDIGTTTIAGFLIDLKTGKELAQVSTLNPQVKYGADVISRINYAKSDEGLERLHREIINGINGLIKKAAKQVGCSITDIYVLTVAGNTTMHHLFLKIQPKSLAATPYVPVVTEALVVDAKEINIEINPAGKVFMFPNIAGFVGGDTVAAALAAEMDRAHKLTLLVDIGTNGEMVLGTKEKLLSCSTAAGPAFEGVEIKCGMRGTIGAIDHISIDTELKYSVIGNTLPQGIAGSGIVDAVAELLKIGVIDEKGRLLRPDEIEKPIGKKYKDRIIEIDGTLAFLIEENTATGEPIYISQKDIREIQLAKGAIAAGIEVLLQTYGAKAEDIEEVYLAGAFGNYLSEESVCKIGLLPPELEGKIKGIGNAAGVGAKLSLLSEKEYKRGIALSKKTKYIELSAHPAFRGIFFNKINF